MVEQGTVPFTLSLVQEVASMQNCPLGNGGETASLSGTCGEENTFYQLIMYA